MTTTSDTRSIMELMEAIKNDGDAVSALRLATTLGNKAASDDTDKAIVRIAVAAVALEERLRAATEGEVGELVSKLLTAAGQIEWDAKHGRIDPARAAAGQWLRKAADRLIALSARVKELEANLHLERASNTVRQWPEWKRGLLGKGKEELVNDIDALRSRVSALEAERNEARAAKGAGICPNCGESGPHFAPPSMGEPGFFTCEPKAAKGGDDDRR